MSSLPAQAGPDTCVVTASQVVCTGDQSSGIRNGFDFSTPPVTTVNVNTLSSDITPAAGVSGIKVMPSVASTNSSGPSLSVTFDGTDPLGGDDLSISTNGTAARAIWVETRSGNGSNGRNAGTGFAGTCIDARSSRSGSVGPGGGAVTVNTQGGRLETNGGSAHGILAVSRAGKGGKGGNGTACKGTSPGGDGGTGGPVTINANSDIQTTATAAHGIVAESVGGGGGNGGNGGAFRNGGRGGTGGTGGRLSITGTGTIETFGTQSHGIFAVSRGGNGGNGGSSSDAGFTGGGDGGAGAGGGLVEITSGWNITTHGAESHGISAHSLGGVGGAGGDGSFFDPDPGAGGNTAPSGNVQVTNNGSIVTFGDDSLGILAQSISGHAGSGGGADSVVQFGADGGSAGDGGAVTVTNNGSIATFGTESHAVLAESIGGGGGNGGSGFGLFYSEGGGGSAGGNGGTVRVENNGLIETFGSGARGLFAQSIGGGGGNGGGSGGIATFGGSGGTTSDGGGVTAINSGTIATRSHAIFAQSVGGGGGNGGSSGGWFSVGGRGGGGGDAGVVRVTSTGRLQTIDADASAIFAQSVGGGGGNGGGSGSIGAFVSVAVGGRGGDGGDGDRVVVNAFHVDGDETGLPDIVTQGDRSHGIFAQSVGGGGGNGGYAVSVALGPGAALAVGVGGNGGGGGAGGLVDVDAGATIATHGRDAHGIFAQSVGGGGGSGGFSIAVSGSDGPSGAFSMGGSGGAGGSAKAVTVASAGDIDTFANHSYGILAQSVGGGGGDGGFSVAGTLSGSVGVGLSFGGGGGVAGNGGAVTVNSAGRITTRGADSHAIMAQSVGGGGSGGFSVSAGITGGGAVGLSLGGGGGSGGSASSVSVTSTGKIDTFGGHSYGILAQSVGGGGGDGGFSVAGALSGGPTLGLSFGGSGAGGGRGGDVDVDNSGDITTRGELSHGIFAQSVGGGGGSGGFSVAGGITTDSAALSFSLGGSGGAGRFAGTVDVDNSGAIETVEKGSHGIVAQSIGGGGGSGGFSGSLAGFGQSANVAVAVGGKGGTGGNASTVTVDNSGDVTTRADASYGVFAQSVGGGGGDGGFGLALALGLDDKAANLSVAIGGTGGAAGKGGGVVVTNSAEIETLGTKSHAIVAQSVGGGGGTGGFSAAGSLSLGTNSKQLAVSVGGAGGAGGDGGAVTVTNTGDIATRAGPARQPDTVFDDIPVPEDPPIPGPPPVAEDPLETLDGSAVGILAQSIGGGGGDGGFSFAGSFAGPEAKNVSVAVGGTGGAGGKGGSVHVDSSGDIATASDDSHGILAQSIGGGGGNGGNSIATGFGIGGGKDTWNVTVNVAVGGSGGNGNFAGQVTVENGGRIVTEGDDAHGVYAQSIGGGGGSGGSSFSASFGLDTKSEGRSIVAQVSVGGGGGNGNHGGLVDVDNRGDIDTFGDQSHAIYAQSIGGGGGSGGDARALHFKFPAGQPKDTEKPAGKGNNWVFTASVGGNGGGASDGGKVTVTNGGDITTRGAVSRGIYAQSIGGGGGSGGSGFIGTTGNELLDTALLLKMLKSLSVSGVLHDVSLSVGGSGGSNGDGGQVTVENTGNITTLGLDSHAIFAQSIGGGGGEAQMYAKGQSDDGSGGDAAIGLSGKVGIGGAGGAAGNGNRVEITNSGRLDTSGSAAFGIFAQSIGGGGGKAGDVNRLLADGNGILGLPSINVGIGLAFGRSGGGGGDGGAVIVTNQDTGSIITRGDDAFGIFAQSVGGGGGMAAKLGNPIPGTDDAPPIGILLGSVGDAGSGGDVTVTQSGTITTLGDRAHGVFAQSAGGKGLGGSVDITLSGDVVTYGADSDGIVAQSRGGNGIGFVGGLFGDTPKSNGDISITIDSGIVQGGSGSGVGVRFLDGFANTLTNRGTITTVDGADGTAITGTIGGETVDNYGIVTGSVDLNVRPDDPLYTRLVFPIGTPDIGLAGNAFNNHVGATFNAGTTINLGGGTLTNAGTLSPGGLGNVLTTSLTGDLTQTADATYAVDLDVSDGTPDRLDVSGTADLAGTVSVSVPNPGWARPGKNEATILTGAGGVTETDLGLVTPPSGVIDYQLSRPNATDVVLTTNIDFSAPRGVTMNGNQRAIAQSINTIQAAGGNAGFAPVAAAIFTLPDGAAVVAAYNQLAPDTHDSGSRSAVSVVHHNVSTVQQRLQRVRASAQTQGGLQTRAEHVQVAAALDGEIYIADRLDLDRLARGRSDYGFWMRDIYQHGDQEGHQGFNGFFFDTGGATFGFDYAPRPNFIGGVSVGLSHTDITFDGRRGKSDINTYVGSVYGGYLTERHYVQGVLSYGKQNFKNLRNITIGALQSSALSDHSGDIFSAAFEGGYKFRDRAWSFEPMASLTYVLLDEEGFQETGAGGANLKVDGHTTNSLVSETGLRVSREFKDDEGLVIPHVSLAWGHDFDVDDRPVTSSFVGSPSVPFTIEGQETRQDSAIVGTGATIIGDWGSASLQYRGQFRSDYAEHSVILNIRLPL